MGFISHKVTYYIVLDTYFSSYLNAFKEIKRAILSYHQKGKRMFSTSLFQTHSILLLHMLSKINAPVDLIVYQH